MDDAAIRAALQRHWADIMNQDDVPAFYDDGVVLEFPQSGERIRGAANVRAMRDAYPARVANTVRRIRGGGPLWVAEQVLTYDGERPTHAVTVMEFRDGKVARETVYFGEPWEPPAWRSPWVEPIDDPPAVAAPKSDDALDAAIDRTRAAIAEFVNGNPAAWTAQCSRRPDATLFGGWGGWERGWDELGPRYGWAASRFAGGTVTF